MTDSYGRKIEYMRVSVTDRCNLRCKYCMPDGIKNIPMPEILTFEEIRDICSAAAELGIKYIRLTGGEPLVRLGVEKLAAMIKEINGIERLTLTTNGVLLKEKLPLLLSAGIDGVNISLDTLDRKKFRDITGFDKLEDVLMSLDAAVKSGIKVKINTVILDDNKDDFIKLASLAEGLPIDVRFIEMMPIGEGGKYRSVSGEAILEELKEKYKKVYPAEENMGNGPAVYYGIRGFKGKIGFINAVHGQFCSQCNRIRLTSTGFLKTCLCYDDGVSLREAVRAKRLDEVKRLMEEAVKNKPAAHCFSQRKGITEERDMSEIGG